MRYQGNNKALDLAIIIVLVSLVLIVGMLIGSKTSTRDQYDQLQNTLQNTSDYMNNVFANPLEIWIFPDPCTLKEIECGPDNDEITDRPLLGKASWYDYTLASGWSSVGHFVCATRDFERYSYVEVTHKDKSVICRVTDFGPDKDLHPDRIIDLSSTAFSKLAPLSEGIIEVKVEQNYETYKLTN